MRLSRPDPLSDKSLGGLADKRLQSVSHQLEYDEARQLLADNIEQLPEQQRIVVTMYYADDLRLKEIGAVLNLSESRISRILSKAETTLRAALLDKDQSNDGK